MVLKDKDFEKREQSLKIKNFQKQQLLAQAEKDLQFLKDHKRQLYSLSLYKVDRSNAKVDQLALQALSQNTLKSYKSIE